MSAAGTRIPAQAWLELFYDLAFVAAIVVVSTAYSRDQSAQQIMWLVIVFALIWTTWLLTTLLLGEVLIVGTTQRALLVTQMGLVLVVAITADATIEDNTFAVGLAVAGILATFVGLLATLGEGPVRSRLDPARVAPLAAAATIFVATSWLRSAWWVPLWLLGLGLVVSAVRLGVPRGEEARHHLVHRFGEFTIIMLGESFLKVGLTASEEPPDLVDLLGLPLTFVLVAAIWWLYFAEVPAADLPTGPGRLRAWVGSHFALHLLVIALAVGLSKLLLPTTDSTLDVRVLMITVPTAGVLLCLSALAWIDDDTTTSPRVRILAISAVLAGVIAGLNGTLDLGAVGSLTLRFGLGATTSLLVLLVLWTIHRVRGLERA